MWEVVAEVRVKFANSAWSRGLAFRYDLPRDSKAGTKYPVFASSVSPCAAVECSPNSAGTLGGREGGSLVLGSDDKSNVELRGLHVAMPSDARS